MSIELTGLEALEKDTAKACDGLSTVIDQSREAILALLEQDEPSVETLDGLVSMMSLMKKKLKAQLNLLEESLVELGMRKHHLKRLRRVTLDNFKDVMGADLNHIEYIDKSIFESKEFSKEISIYRNVFEDENHVEKAGDDISFDGDLSVGSEVLISHNGKEATLKVLNMQGRIEYNHDLPREYGCQELKLVVFCSLRNDRGHGALTMTIPFSVQR